MSQSEEFEDPGFKGSSVDILNTANPRSVINLVPPEFAKTMRQIPKFYYEMTEREARNKFRPDPVMNQLRAAFWVEYNLTQLEGREKMNIARVHAGIVTNQFFYARVIKSPEYVAWMILPPFSYEVVLNEAMLAAMMRLRDVIDEDLLTSGGKVDVKIASFVFRIWQALDARHKGTLPFKPPKREKVDPGELVAAVEKPDTHGIGKKMRELRAKAPRHEAPKVKPMELDKVASDE